MKFANTKSKRVCLIIITIAFSAVVIFILILSPLTKYLVERYDVRYTGREIELGWVFVNPFTGFVHFNDVKIYEQKKDTLFLTAKGVSADFELLKLFSRTYEVASLTLDYPRGVITRTNKHVNLDDLILRFGHDSTDTKSTPSQVNILNIKINHGEFYYREKAIPINYLVRDLQMSSSGFRWNSDSIASDFSFFSPDQKGKARGNFTINTRTKDYRLFASVQRFNMEIIRQYLWELINFGYFAAQLNAVVHVKGNFKTPEDIDARGRVEVSDFQLGKTKQESYVAFKNLVVAIDRLSPIHKKFLFDSITLRKPFFNYEIYDSLNNVEMLFGKRGSNISDVTSQSGRFNLVIEIGRYLKKISRHFFQSNYRINRLRVTEANLRFSDFSLSEQFTIEASNLSLRADSVDKKNNRVSAAIRSDIKPFGDFSARLSINPKDSGDFDFVYHFNHVAASSFNPYLVTLTSFPLDKGTMSLNGVWNVRKSKINSVNHLVILDPRISHRIKNKELRWIPLPLIMAFVRERGNVIDYEIPITGDLKNPHFVLRDAILDVIKNIFVKPVTIPYGVTMKSAVTEIDNSLALQWNVRQSSFDHKQQRTIKKMARFLKRKTEETISVHPQEYNLREKEAILFFEAKKKYYSLIHALKPGSLSEDDSTAVERMSIKDGAFMHHLKRGKGASDTTLFTIQDKCLNYVGATLVDNKYRHMVMLRKREFMAPFIDNATESRVQMHVDAAGVTRTGFSYFKIFYKGGIPEDLQSAFDVMRYFNNEKLRRRYFPPKDTVQIKR